jgi:ribosomal protein L37AE/L43A
MNKNKEALDSLVYMCILAPMSELVEKKTETPRCPHCESTQTYVRIKTNEGVCRTCGQTWKRTIPENKEPVSD